ncbi:MAG: hypothetical protein ABJA84_00065 [Polaromonas sp.]
MSAIITLADGGNVVTLHPDLYWSDENNWHPVEQSAQRTVTGALIVQVSTRIAGRPITLESQDDSSAWMTRTVIDALRNLAAAPGKVMTLTLHGTSRSVMFRHHDGGFEATPVVQYNLPDDVDFYTATLRLMEL